MSIMVTNR